MSFRQPRAPRNIFAKNQLAAQMFSRFVELTLVGFAHIVTRFPEVVELKRMSGDIDCLLKCVVTDSPSKDALYKCLIAAVHLNDGSSSLAMEAINWTTALPLGEAS